MEWAVMGGNGRSAVSAVRRCGVEGPQPRPTADDPTGLRGQWRRGRAFVRFRERQSARRSRPWQAGPCPGWRLPSVRTGMGEAGAASRVQAGFMCLSGHNPARPALPVPVTRSRICNGRCCRAMCGFEGRSGMVEVGVGVMFAVLPREMYVTKTVQPAFYFTN